MLRLRFKEIQVMTLQAEKMNVPEDDEDLVDLRAERTTNGHDEDQEEEEEDDEIQDDDILLQAQHDQEEQ